jgi:hypothetical protein
VRGSTCSRFIAENYDSMIRDLSYCKFNIGVSQVKEKRENAEKDAHGLEIKVSTYPPELAHNETPSRGGKTNHVW